MANLVITNTTNCIAVDFGALSSDSGMKNGNWTKSNITFIALDNSESFVSIGLSSGDTWRISYNSFQSALVVDSVAGVAPVSNSDLCTKMKALIA